MEGENDGLEEDKLRLNIHDQIQIASDEKRDRRKRKDEEERIAHF